MDRIVVSARRSALGILAAVAVCACFIFLIPGESLSYTGRAALGLMAALVVMVITEALPLVIVAVALMMATFGLGILSYDEVWTAFGNYIIFLVIAMFGLCRAIEKTSLPQRIIGKVLRWSGTDSRKLVFGFALCTALTSSIMSNITACLIYMGLALGLLKANGSDKPGKSALGRTLFILIPACSVIGGISALPGNSYNVLAVSLMQQQLGVEFSYLQWMIVGYPTAILLTMLVAWWLCVVFKPEALKADAVENMLHVADELGPITALEKKVLVIVSAMLVFWVASTWVDWLNTNIVACAGLIVMFLPGVRVLEQKEFIDSIPLDIIMFLGCSMAFMSGFMQTDAASWIMSMVFSGAESWPYLLVLIMVAAVPIVAHVLIQAGAVIIMLCVPTLITLAVSCGIDPLVVGFVAALGGGVQFLLPIDGIYLMAYGYRYYSVEDLLKFGWLPTIAMLVECVVIVPPLVKLAMLV